MNNHSSFRFLGITLFLALGLAVFPAAARAQEGASPAPPSIADATAENPEYRFLTLGEKKDYLKAERWRVIDQIEQAIPALYEPRLPFHGYTLPPGAWRIGLGITYAHNPSDFGTDDFYSLFFDEVEINTTRVNLDVFYGFEVGPLRDLVVRLNVPYQSNRVTGTGHPFRIDPMVMTMNGSGSGIGDVSLTLKKKWLDQGNGPLNFSTLMGVIFPTAEDDQSFEGAQTLFMGGEPMMATSSAIPGSPTINLFGREPGDLFLPRAAQPGNGSWGARFGFGLTRQFERSAFHAGLIFDWLSDNDGITPGNDLRYGLSYTLPPTASDRVTLDLSVIGRWQGNESFPGMIMHAERDPDTGMPIMNPDMSLAMFVTPRPDFNHGHVMFISPSLVLITSPNSRIVMSPMIRVRQPDQGPSPRWAFTIANTFTF